MKNRQFRRRQIAYRCFIKVIQEHSYVLFLEITLFRFLGLKKKTLFSHVEIVLSEKFKDACVSDAKGTSVWLDSTAPTLKLKLAYSNFNITVGDCTKKAHN